MPYQHLWGLRNGNSNIGYQLFYNTVDCPWTGDDKDEFEASGNEIRENFSLEAKKTKHAGRVFNNSDSGHI